MNEREQKKEIRQEAVQQRHHEKQQKTQQLEIQKQRNSKAKVLKKQHRQKSKQIEKQIALSQRLESRAFRENWYKLDNAATIYPAICSSNWNYVFRLSAELKQDVRVDKLQEAVNLTVKRYPIFNVCLRNGLFWHYFQPVAGAPQVEKEKDYPCQPFNVDKRQALIRVLYFENKIVFETFHALTDGYGATVFFNTLLTCYLELCGNKIDIADKRFNVKDKYVQEEGEDAFRQYAKFDKTKTRKEHKAFAVEGDLEGQSVLKIIKGTASVKKTKEVAKKFNATINEFLSAVYMNAMLMQKKRSKSNRRPIKLSVPVNLRKHFETRTLKNFSAYYNLELPTDKEDIEFEDLIKLIQEQKSTYNDEFLLKFLSSNVKSERNFFVRIMPLAVKDFMLKIIYNFVGEVLFTSTISNIGVIDLPQNVAKHIDSYYMSLGSTKLNKFNLAVASLGDKMEMCFTSRLKSNQIMQDFFTQLTSFGIDVSVETNM